MIRVKNNSVIVRLTEEVHSWPCSKSVAKASIDRQLTPFIYSVDILFSDGSKRIVNCREYSEALSVIDAVESHMGECAC